MRLTGSTTAFGRHESFPLRFGWITKGLEALADDPKIFTREDATVVLGVGKNMVSSIRYWLQATRIAHRDPKTNAVKPSPLAEVVFGDDGDPYLEDEGTIWLLPPASLDRAPFNNWVATMISQTPLIAKLAASVSPSYAEGSERSTQGRPRQAEAVARFWQLWLGWQIGKPETLEAIHQAWEE